MNNYILATDFGKANVSDKLYYVMAKADLATLVSENTITFGDKAYIIKEGSVVFRGNDNKWYDADGQEVS